ncbi:hypothetical protein NITLEN_10104 [Nitrospira lenta]|uniref:Uncharacterized protein n=1 Tax=Nitrospira lenta TaxID=1436998 RepID=A0A330KZT9_9BACT|nr:hypothetical protein NITLEN_10104 [Nitrospira lenta]
MLALNPVVVTTATRLLRLGGNHDLKLAFDHRFRGIQPTAGKKKVSGTIVRGSGMN